MDTSKFDKEPNNPMLLCLLPNDPEDASDRYSEGINETLIDGKRMKVEKIVVRTTTSDIFANSKRYTDIIQTVGREAMAHLSREVLQSVALRGPGYVKFIVRRAEKRELVGETEFQFIALIGRLQ